MPVLFDELMFIEDPPKEIEIECPICFEVMCEDPCLVSCCGHHFCGRCIRQIKSQSNSCPLCKDTKFQAMSNKGLSRTILNLSVYCSKRKDGCSWKGTIKEMQEHQNLSGGRREGVCKHIEVTCGHFRCTTKRKLSEIQAHESTCPFRPHVCEHCKVYADAYTTVVNYHYRICDAFPMACPNDCLVKDIPRNKIQDHLRHKCSLVTVACQFAWAGCTHALVRGDLEEHMVANVVEHMSLLSTACLQIKQENEDLKRKVEFLSAKRPGLH